MLGWQVLDSTVKSRFSHIVMLLSAIFAFVPVMAVDYLLDNYVRVRERAQLQQHDRRRRREDPDQRL